MATLPHSKPSFAPRHKWSIALQVCLTVLVVLTIAVMVNYLSRDYFLRFHVSTRTRIVLSPSTVSLLKSLTNEVKITLYYDAKNEPLYKDVADLLNEYRLVNSRVFVQTVDYLRDPAAAQRIKEKYELAAATEKNKVIFDSGGRTRVVDGNALAQYVLEQVPHETERAFRRKPTAFLGEVAFTAALLDVSSSKPLNAYFLLGHGEHSVTSNDDYGYLKFAAVLQQHCIRAQPLSLLGTNAVPMDCNLLVVGGPTREIPGSELEKIEQFLNQGGRMLVLLSAQALDKETRLDRTGLDKVMLKWGIEPGNVVIQDPENTIRGWDVVVRDFSRQHPMVNPLLLSGLYLLQPRPVGQLKSRVQAADAPAAEEVAFSGSKATAPAPGPSGRFPLIVAVEKGAIKGVITERGSTRIVVAGDSMFLANGCIESAANRDFAGYAVNWLLDRAQFLKGPGPRPVMEYRVVMTRAQLQAAQWILLGGMPGTVLILGGLVWLRRRG